MRLTYKLFLKNDIGTRVAIYDPYLSILVWEDNGERLILPQEMQHKFTVDKVSPQKPIGKSIALKRIKIQMGLACNYSCSYCSQKNQRNFQESTVRETLDKVPRFMEKMQNWFNGGKDGLGSGVSLEFWGGETLLYWRAVEKMARELRLRYPNIRLALFTNGSIVSKAMTDVASEVRIQFIVSHDGPTFSEDRSKDPFDILSQNENLKYLFSKLNPLGLISFNATISPKNFSLLTIRKYIADKLGVKPAQVKLTHDLATPYDAAGLEFVGSKGKRTDLINGIFNELLKQYPFDLNVGMISILVNDFFESISGNRSAEGVGQKCSMDLPTSIAVDIDGNILTCQNVTAKGGHKIGHVDQLTEAKLDTSYHWSQRSECVKCPVVQICKGSCMFLTDKLWTASCDQHFTWSLAYLAFALFIQSERYLVKIEGNAIRKSEEIMTEVLRH